MQITALFQDLVNQIMQDINILDARNINLGDLLTAQVKAVNGDSVLVRVQGKDILAKSLVPMVVGEAITFQYQGMQQGKVVFKLVNDSNPNQELAMNKILNSLQLPENETNQEIIKQMVQMQLPLIKSDILKLSSVINKLSLPNEAITEVVFLNKQGLPLTEQNINYMQQFTTDNLSLYKGLSDIKSILINQQELPADIVQDLQVLIGKLAEIQITVQDNSPDVANKLARALNWLADEAKLSKLSPEVSPQVNDSTIKTALGSQAALVNEEQITNKTTNINPPPTILELSSSQVTEEPTMMNNQTVLVDNNSKAIIEQNIAKPTIDVLQSQIVFLAEKTISDLDKFNLFVTKIKQALADNGQKIAEIINNISKKLDSANPQEHIIKDVLQEMGNKINFLDRLIPAGVNDNNQQVLLYAQTLFNNGQNQTPVNLNIKRSADQQGRKINFNDCTLTVSLQTLNLGFIKASVKKVERSLSCQFFVPNQKIKAIIEPALPQLVEALNVLNFQTSFLPIKITPDKMVQNAFTSGKPISLFNVDVRI